MASTGRSKTGTSSKVRFQGGMDSTDAGGSKITYFDVVKRLPAYLSKVKKWMALGGVGVIINSATSVITPLAVALATNNMISGNVSMLTWAAIGYIVLTLINWAGQYMQISFLTYAGQRTLYKMRTQLFDHLQMMPLSFYDNNKVGKIMSRVQNDVGQLQSLVSQDIITLMANALTLLTIAAIMLIMNVKLGLLTLTFVPVLFIVVLFWQRRAREAFMNARQTISTVNDKIQEGVSGVRVSQSMSRERVNLQEFETVNRSNFQANMRATKLHAFMWPIMDILTSAAYALVLVYGGFQVLNKTMEVGTLLAFLLYVQKFVGPVTRMTQQYTDIQNTLASGVRIFELMDIEPQIKDSSAAIEMPVIKGEIDFQNVTFAYENDEDVLKEINLKIAAGETVAIAGQTGAGKSSLTNLITRFYDVRDGAVLIDGYNVKSVTQNSLRRQIGIVPQDPFLFSGTIEDNIKYGRPEATHEQVVKASRSAGAYDFISRLEKGFQTSVGERGSSLSAGQRQLVCMARAILIEPRILILDEATSSIDTNTERIMQESLHEISKGRTLVIIAHRLSTITKADRIIVLDNGRIIEIGSHSELMAKPGKYFQMYQSLSAPVLDETISSN